MGVSKADTRQLILDTAETMLQRQGLQHLTIVDVARKLNMSHANVYRYYANKAALMAALAEAWLKRISDPLEVWVTADQSADACLIGWCLALAEAKRKKVLSDPELFNAFQTLIAEATEVVSAHLETLIRQLEQILISGNQQALWQVHDPAAAAQLLLQATSRYHKPALLLAEGVPPDPQGLEQLLKLLIGGLKSGVI